MEIKKWYIPLFLLLITAFVPWIKETRRVNQLEENILLENAPQYTLEQIRSEMKWVQKTERAWIQSAEKRSASGFLPDKPALYWEFLNRRTMLEDAMKRFIAKDKYLTETENIPEAIQRLKSLEVVDPTAIINSYFLSKFGNEAMVAARPTNGYFETRWKRPMVTDDHCALLFLQGYLWSIPIMLLVFCVRLRARNLLIWPELHWIALTSIGWPVGLLVYPRNLRRGEQIRRAVQFVAQFASAAVGFFGLGANMPIKAQVQPKSGGQMSSQKQKRVSVSFGLEIYPTTTGIDAGDMFSPWYSHKEELGKGFSLSGFGFVEVGERKSLLFTNNSVSISHQHSKGLMFTTEVGGSPTGLFSQVGLRINLVKVPFIGQEVSRTMKSVVYGRGWRVRGPTHFQENFLFWTSKELPIGSGITVATEGFMRFRIGKIPNVGQPQLIFRHKRLRHLDFITEFWMIGCNPTVRFGVQLH